MAILAEWFPCLYFNPQVFQLLLFLFSPPSSWMVGVVSGWLDAWLPAGATPAQDVITNISSQTQQATHSDPLLIKNISSRKNRLQKTYSFTITLPPKTSDLNLLTLLVTVITVIRNDSFYLMPRPLPSATLRTRMTFWGFFEMWFYQWRSWEKNPTDFTYLLYVMPHGIK